MSEEEGRFPLDKVPKGYFNGSLTPKKLAKITGREEEDYEKIKSEIGEDKMAKGYFAVAPEGKTEINLSGDQEDEHNE